MRFWKMNGAGNDFIIINNLAERLPLLLIPPLARIVCERHLSIGADGLMLVCPADGEGDFKMLFYNSDGSPGEMCGNGARCLCRFAFETGLSKDIQMIETTAGVITGFRINESDYKVRLNDPTIVETGIDIVLNGVTFDCSYVELGAPGLPHTVVLLEDMNAYDEEELRAIGRELRHHKSFPKGANVDFCQVIDRKHVLIKTYERGVEDFTYACGTGAGATALALTAKGLTERESELTSRGGTLKIRVETEGEDFKSLWLTGPTNIVAMGELFDENIRKLIGGKA